LGPETGVLSVVLVSEFFLELQFRAAKWLFKRARGRFSCTLARDIKQLVWSDPERCALR